VAAVNDPRDLLVRKMLLEEGEGQAKVGGRGGEDAVQTKLMGGASDTDTHWPRAPQRIGIKTDRGEVAWIPEIEQFGDADCDAEKVSGGDQVSGHDVHHRIHKPAVGLSDDARDWLAEINHRKAMLRTPASTAG
jgi:hypothetical protein